MAESRNQSLVVGLFILSGILCMLYLALVWPSVRITDDSYILKARFVSASGLREGAGIEIAGVVVGQVDKIVFDEINYQALVDLRLPKHILIQEDAIASIRTTGVMGPKFIKISPGGSETLLAAGDVMYETESSISIEELVSKYIFDSGR